jgi:hypothetical protein
MEILEAPKTDLKPILLSVNQKAIDELQKIADANLSLLNRIADLSGLRSKEEIIEAHSNRKKFILELFFLRFPQAKEQAQYSNLEFVYPPDLEELNRLLSQFNPNFSFKFCEYHKKSGKWILDERDWINQTSKFKTFCTTEEQIKRYHLAKAVLDFVKSIGELSQRRFNDCQILQNKIGEGWIINPNFIFGEYKF